MEEVCAKLAPDSDEVQREDLGRQITFHEQELVKMQGTLFGGTEAYATALKQCGYTLAICSNGKEEYLETVLSVCNIRRFFSAVKGKTISDDQGRAATRTFDGARSFVCCYGGVTAFMILTPLERIISQVLVSVLDMVARKSFQRTV